MHPQQILVVIPRLASVMVVHGAGSGFSRKKRSDGGTARKSLVNTRDRDHTARPAPISLNCVPSGPFSLNLRQ